MHTRSIRLDDGTEAFVSYDSGHDGSAQLSWGSDADDHHAVIVPCAVLDALADAGKLAALESDAFAALENVFDTARSSKTQAVAAERHTLIEYIVLELIAAFHIGRHEHVRHLIAQLAEAMTAEPSPRMKAARLLRLFASEGTTNEQHETLRRAADVLEEMNK